MERTISSNIQVDNCIVGIINYHSKSKSYYSAEVILNGPICMRLIDEHNKAKISDTKTIKVLKGETKYDLNFQILEFIKEIIPNIDFNIVGRI